MVESVLFYFPRETFNDRLSKNRMSEIVLFSDHPKMLRDVCISKKKELQKILARYKSQYGLGDAIEVIFTEGKRIIPNTLDGSPKEVKSIIIRTKYDIPSIRISVRLV